MGQVGGSVRASTGTTVRGVYLPQGVVSADDPQRNNAVARHANDAVATLEYGTGSGFVDRTSVSDRAVAAGSSVTWDLYTGTDLPGLQDEAAPFRLVKFLKISILSGGDTSGVRVGGAAADEWVGFFESAGDSLDIFPDGPPFLVGSPAGKAVGSSTKNLKVENLGASEVVLRVVVAGSTTAPGEWVGFFGLLTYP
jgi:hypothetical protein